jgi:hypothetical protein
MIDIRGSRLLIVAAAAFATLATLGSNTGRAQIAPPRVGPAGPIPPKSPALALPGPQTINASTLVLAGRDSGPRVIDTQTLVLSGPDSGPRVVDAQTLVLAGRDSGPRTLDAAAIVLSGRRK